MPTQTQIYASECQQSDDMNNFLQCSVSSVVSGAASPAPPCHAAMHCNAVIPNGARHTTHYTPASDTLTGEPGQATNAGCSEDILTFPSFYPKPCPHAYHSITAQCAMFAGACVRVLA